MDCCSSLNRNQPEFSEGNNLSKNWQESSRPRIFTAFPKQPTSVHSTPLSSKNTIVMRKQTAPIFRSMDNRRKQKFQTICYARICLRPGAQHCYLGQKVAIKLSFVVHFGPRSDSQQCCGDATNSTAACRAYIGAREQH